MRDFEIQTDHFQFYFGDARHGPGADCEGMWDEGGALVLVMGPDRDVFGVGTVRYGGTTHIQAGVVAGRAEVSAAAEWEILGEFQLEVPSGKVLFWAAEDADLTGAQAIQLAPGKYRGLVQASGADAVEDAMDKDGPDVYRVSFWLDAG